MQPVIIPRSNHPISRTWISPNAVRVLYRLKEQGFRAFLVGGGVRDLLLGREPKDFDIATDARPNEVKKVLNVLREDESKMAANWSRRFKNNIEKLRSGDIYQVAEVVRTLSIRERERVVAERRGALERDHSLLGAARLQLGEPQEQRDPVAALLGAVALVAGGVAVTPPR